MVAHKRDRSTRLWVVLAALAGLISSIVLVQVWAGQTSNAVHLEGSSESQLPPPQSIENLIQPAEIIVIGTVDSIAQESTFGGYDEAGNVIHNQDPSLRNGEIPITDYRIEVERVLRDGGALESGEPLILRMLGHLDQQPADRVLPFPMSTVGERRLFFLSQNPDGTYGLYYGPWSRLNIDSSVVTRSDGAQTPLRFGGHTFTPAEFVDRVAQAIPRVPVQRPSLRPSSGQGQAPAQEQAPAQGPQERPTPGTP